MKSLRGVIAALLVAIYAVATFGYDLSVTLCHCTQSEHVRLHHSHECHDCHHCQHNAATDGISSSRSCDCSHDHSPEIDLYDKNRTSNPLIKPLVCDAIIPATFSPQTLAISFKAEPIESDAEELPDAPDEAPFGLRAPPVLA